MVRYEIVVARLKKAKEDVVCSAKKWSAGNKVTAVLPGWGRMAEGYLGILIR